MHAAALVLILCARIQDPVDEAKVRGLIGQLGADFLEEREAARKGLEKAGKAAEGLLIESLGAADYRVRHACFELLTVLKSPKALARAAELMKGDDDGSVRDAAFALVRALGKDAEDALIAALDSPNPRYRLESIQALGEMKSEKCVARMTEMYDREPDKAIKDAAFKCLQALGAPAEGFLLKHLVSTDPALRRDALEGLKKVQNARILEAVGKLFPAETDEKIIQDAFEYLKGAKEKGEPHLVAGLKSAQERVRLRSVQGLRDLKNAAAIGPVSEVFQGDDSGEVRREAAQFLESQGLKAEDALIAALASPTVEVKLLAIDALGKIKSERPMEKISALFREDKSREVHEKSFEYLKRLEGKAEKDLLAALGDESKKIRKEAIETLGRMKAESAIPRFIEFMIELDPEIKKAAEDALVKIGPKAIGAVDKAVTEGKIKKRTAEAILALFYEEEVERLLDRLVTVQGGAGFYEGQFKEIEAFGREKAMPVLLKIAREAGYVFRAADRSERPRGYSVRMRELAVMSLGELGDKAAVESLREVLQTVPKDLALTRDGLYEEVVVALHRLGERQAVDEFVRKGQADAEAAFAGASKEDGCHALFSLGLVLNRVGRRDEAAETYAKVIRAAEEHKLATRTLEVWPTTHYNLACLSALKGEKEKAIDWLEKAVKNGFVDRQWIGVDRDLDGVRGEERFKKLLADDKLFEAKPND